MSDKNSERPGDKTDPERRKLMKLATAAGLVGAVGLGTTNAQAQQNVSETAVDPSPPEGLGDTAIPDQRFPLVYETSVAEGARVMMQHVAALGRRDIEAVAETLHFPFGSYEGTDLVVIDTPEEFMAKPPASLNMTNNPRRHTDNDGYMKPGCYDVFHGMEMIACNPVNATMGVSYDRYDNTGKHLLRCEGMYAVTNNDGKWGIQLASTIFRPADMIGVVFEDAVREAKVARVHHTLSADTGDASFDYLSRQYGPGASVSGSASWTAALVSKERVMQAYRVKGVKSRLNVSDTTPDTPLRGNRGSYEDYWETMGKIGLGPWGFIYGTFKEGRVVHHTHNKAHVLASAVRYTATGEMMSLAVQAAVATYKNARWGLSGNLIYATPFDRANDIHPGGLEPV